MCMYVCMYVCKSTAGLQFKYTIKFYVSFTPNCRVHALCYDDDNPGGPVTKTVNLLYAGRQETCVLGAE